MGKIISSFLLFFLCFTTVKAEKMSYENHTLVINKLYTALALMKKNDPSLLPTKKRLADLHSERARIVEFRKEEGRCQSCVSINTDRKNAIQLYLEVMSLGLESGAIITQVAHLYELTGQEKKSKSLFQRIIKKSTPTYSSLLVGEAHLSMAYNYYKKDVNKKALYHFQRAKKFKTKQPTSVTNYYIAWCKFNLGHESIARQLMEQSLKQALPLAKNDKEMSLFTHQASKDLAVFYARTHLTNHRINKLLELTPTEVRIGNFKELAYEVERLGKHKSTAKIWGLIAQVTREPTAKIEAQFRYAKSSYNIGALSKAHLQFQKATQLWKNQSCKTTDDFDCAELKKEFRNFIINWNNTEKSKSSAQLILSYLDYLRLFPSDLEMSRWGAQAAISRSDYLKAKSFYRHISTYQINSNLALQEGALMAEIEVAEKLKNPKEKLESYAFYLKNNPNGKNRYKVKYQLAQLQYDLKNYRAAGEIFCSLTQQSENQKIRVPSAHLCLDTHALTNNSEKIEKKALLFAVMFRKHSSDFLKIARKASLNIVAQQLSQEKPSSQKFQESLSRLEKISLQGASQQEKLSVYQNISIVAEQLNKIPRALSATNAILALNGLSNKDNDKALKRKVWLSELHLDFKTALMTYKKIYPVKKANHNQLLKMSLLSELAGKDSTYYDKKLLAKTKNKQKANEIRAKIVLASKTPWTVFNKYFHSLKKSPLIFTSLALEVYAKYKNLRHLKRVLKQKNVRKFAAGQRLHRQMNMQNINSLKKKLRKHKISTRTNKKLTRSLGQRISLIGQLEKQLNQSVQSKDWISQAISLEIISYEYHRLYKNILSFPVPKGLNAKDSQQYQVLINQQASPYLKKSTTAKQKAQSFWQNSQLFNTLISQHNQAQKNIQRLIGQEVRELSRYAPEANRQILAQAQIVAPPRKNEIISTYKKIQSQPFNVNFISEGISLENRRHRKTMASYLGQRLKLAQNKGRR